MNQYPN